jgi:tetratricopeptide (TPR) repeat protein
MRVAATKKLLTLGTLVAFSFLVLFSDYGFAQGTTPLDRAQDLLSQGKYDDAVKMLDSYIGEIQAKPEEKPTLAAAWYLLAKVYFEVGDDAKCDEALLNVFNTHPGFDRTEPNSGFRERVLKAKSQLAGKVPVAAETTAQPVAPPKETETKVPKTEPLPAKIDTKTVVQPLKVETKTIGQQPKVEPQTVEMPKKSPAAVVKKKKKFPWLLAILGVGVVVALIIILTKKKSDSLTLKVTVGEGVTGNPSAGSFLYKKGDKITYSYSLATSATYIYNDLSVLLDGNKLSASGTITMDGNHTLSISASKISAIYPTIYTYYWDNGWVELARWEDPGLLKECYFAYYLLEEPNASGVWISFDNVSAHGNILPNGSIYDDFNDGIIAPIWEKHICTSGSVIETNGVIQISGGVTNCRTELCTRDSVIQGDFDVQIDFELYPRFHTDSFNQRAILHVRDISNLNGNEIIIGVSKNFYSTSMKFNDIYTDIGRAGTTQLTGKLRIVKQSPPQ